MLLAPAYQCRNQKSHGSPRTDNLDTQPCDWPKLRRRCRICCIPSSSALARIELSHPCLLVRSYGITCPVKPSPKKASSTRIRSAIALLNELNSLDGIQYSSC